MVGCYRKIDENTKCGDYDDNGIFICPDCEDNIDELEMGSNFEREE